MPKLSKSDRAADESASEARRRKEVALARLRELEVQAKEGELVTMEAALDVVTKAFGAVKAAVLRIPDKATRHVMAAGDARAGRDLLMAECENALKGAHDDLCRFAGKPTL